VAENREYTIRRAQSAVKLNLDSPCWDQAERLEIDRYPWYVKGGKQATSVAVLYDDQALYLLAVCEDKHIYSVETRPNGNVYLDSCVEFFCMPDPDKQQGYFNFEANCCGTVHLGWGPGRPDRKLAGPEVHSLLKVCTSIPMPTRDESPNDDGWWLAAMIPFTAIAKLSGKKFAPKGGDAWRANFYRCGGKTEDQYAAWNHIDIQQPDFHRPDFFGTLRFE
jgi:hypothetical protein